MYVHMVFPSNQTLAMGLDAWNFFPLTDQMHEDHFFVTESGRRLATPLFIALIVIETTDVAFAVDSIPAVFSVSRDPFIVLTSNIFAILGLRALYFALAAIAKYFTYLKYGVYTALACHHLRRTGSFHAPIGDCVKK